MNLSVVIHHRNSFESLFILFIKLGVSLFKLNKIAETCYRIQSNYEIYTFVDKLLSTSRSGCRYVFSLYIIIKVCYYDVINDFIYIGMSRDAT